MDGVALYRAARAETGVDPGWREVGSLRLPRRRSGSRSCAARRAGRATFGLPLELVGRRRGAGPIPADVDRRRAGRRVAADRRLARPVRPGARPGRRCTRGRARGSGRTHRVVAIERRRRPRDGRRGRARAASAATIATEVVVNAGGHVRARDRAPRRRHTCPIIPMAHQYLFTEAIEGVHPDLPQLRDPDNLVYFREEVGGLCMGGYERNPAPWSASTAIPADFNGKLLAPDWPRFEEIMAGAVRRVPAMADARRPAARSTARRRSRRTTSSSSASPRCAASSWRPGSAPTASPGPAASAARWRAGSSTASPSWTCGGWTSAASARSTGRAATRLPARPRSTRPTTTSTTPTRSARPAGRCGLSPTYPRLVALGAAFGEKSGWERPNWFEPNADDPRRRRSVEALRPRGWAGRTGRPAIGAEALATRTDGRAVRRDVVRQARGQRARRAARSCSGLCANDIDRPVGTVVYTALLNRRGGHRVRPDGHAASAEERYLLVTGTAFGNHDLGWLRRHAARRRHRCAIRDVTSARACFGLWGPRGPRHPRAADRRRPLGRRLPVPDRAPDQPSAPCRSARCGSRTSASSAGSCTPPPSTASRCGTRSGRRAEPHGMRRRRAIAPSTRCGWRRATACGPATSRPRRRRTRPGSGSRSQLDKAGGFLGREALVARRRAGPRKRLRCLVLDDPRSVCLGNEPVRVDGEIVGRVTSRRLRVRGRAVDRLRLPAARRRRVGTRGEVEVFGDVGRVRGHARAAVRPRRRADPVVSGEAARSERRGRRRSLAAPRRSAVAWLDFALGRCRRRRRGRAPRFRRDVEVSDETRSLVSSRPPIPRSSADPRAHRRRVAGARRGGRRVRHGTGRQRGALVHRPHRRHRKLRPGRAPVRAAARARGRRASSRWAWSRCRRSRSGGGRRADSARGTAARGGARAKRDASRPRRSVRWATRTCSTASSTS